MRRRSPSSPDTSPEAARQVALRLLGMRELSRAQLLDRLRRRQFPADVIKATLDRLTADGLLDDARAARAFARHEAVIRRHGRDRALRQVRALGVDRQTAREAIGDVFGEVDEDELLHQAVSRRLKGQPLPSDRQARRRLHGWLLRQGFEPAKVSALFGRSNTSDTEE
jgi:regulatory protein